MAGVVGVSDPLGYHAMRMRWCAAALLAFARRWGVYFVVGVMAIGAGSSAGIDAVRAMAAWSVLPLFRSAGAGGWVVVAIALQAAAGALLVRGMRGLLWPERWLSAERALPIDPRDTLRSDLVVVAFALSPLVSLYAVGAGTLVERDPAWLQPTEGRALAALGLAIVGSVVLGVAILQAMRRAGPAASRAQLLESSPVSATRTAMVPSHWRRILLLLPLWRGPARRTGGALASAVPILVAPAVTMAMRPAAASWCLAAYGVLAMLVTARVRVHATDDFRLLRQACVPLPLSPTSLRTGIDVLVLSPVLVSAPLLLACLPWMAVRPSVLAAYGASGLACCVAETRSTSTDPVAASSRWLLCAVLLLALASEVIA